MRSTSSSTVEVSGPGVEGKAMPSLGAGLSFAQMRANRDGGTFYVRTATETWVVEQREEKRLTLTYLLDGDAPEAETPKPTAAELVTL